MDIIVANKLQEVINTLNRIFGKKIKWEYDYLHVGDAASDDELLTALNKRGCEGWEVIGLIQGKIWMKRKI